MPEKNHWAVDRTDICRYNKPEITAVGRELDALLVGPIALLGGDIPPQLVTETTERQLGS